jgi:hypothetical protein
MHLLVVEVGLVLGEVTMGRLSPQGGEAPGLVGEALA